jgi:hypothetical protein
MGLILYTVTLLAAPRLRNTGERHIQCKFHFYENLSLYVDGHASRNGRFMVSLKQEHQNQTATDCDNVHLSLRCQKIDARRNHASTTRHPEAGDLCGLRSRSA